MAAGMLNLSVGFIRAALAAWVLLCCALPLFSRRRSDPKSAARPFLAMTALTAFALSLLAQQLFCAREEHRAAIGLAFGVLTALGWAALLLLRKLRPGRQEELILALFLTTVGFSVAASSTPEGMVKQSALFALALAAFFLLGALLKDPKRAHALRWAMAVGALGVLALNLLLSERVWGAKNWLSIAGQSLQPSELVKVAYIFAGSAMLDGPKERRQLALFTAFSAVVVAALAAMGDFGTALVFFLCFLVIVFLRTGSLVTIVLSLTGAVGASAVVLRVKPYVARRFLSWGHAWETPLDEGFQQVRAMSAAASGGLFGRGAGNGWLRYIVAADTDLVFGMVCEELGLLVAVCCVLAVSLLAVLAVRRARESGSPFVLTAAGAAAGVLLVQTALNVFGSLDMLPFTGVTFPFVSRGGSSLIACASMLAFMTAGTRPAAVPKPAAAKKAAAKKAAAKKAAAKKTAPAAKKPRKETSSQTFKKPATEKPSAKKPAAKKAANGKKAAR